MIVVIALAVAVPASMAMIRSAIRTRTTSGNTVKALALAAGVLEHTMADIASPAPDLGFAALADVAAYTDDPLIGLYARLGAFTSPYAQAGFEYRLDIGELSDATGTATGEPELDIYRLVTVTVDYPDGFGRTLSLPVAMLAGEVSP